MIKISILAATIACTAASVQAASITNGSFEENSAINVGGFATLSAGSTAITGWTVGGTSVDWIGSYWQNADQNRSLDMSGSRAGSISQVLSGLVAGTKYLVSFAMSGNPAGTPAVKTLNVAVGNETSDFTYDVTGNTRSAMNWIYKSFSFTADSVSETLIFTSKDNTAYGPALDDVSISAVPLPAGAWLLGGALAGLGVMRRKSS